MVHLLTSRLAWRQAAIQVLVSSRSSITQQYGKLWWCQAQKHGFSRVTLTSSIICSWLRVPAKWPSEVELPFIVVCPCINRRQGSIMVPAFCPWNFAQAEQRLQAIWVEQCFLIPICRYDGVIGQELNWRASAFAEVEWKRKRFGCSRAPQYF